MTASTTTGRWRWPAEWEPQDGVLLAWPHAGTDWVDNLAEVEATYVALVATIARHEVAVVGVADAALRDRARGLLSAAGADLGRVRFVALDYDDTWLRDSGPITLTDGSARRLLDFRFTGWGGKFEASRDDRIIESLTAAGVFVAADHVRIDFALEGGGIESDGAGTVLTTFRCLHQRHPQLTRAELAAKLAADLVAGRVLILEAGYLEGDDTDAHIDTLARFAAVDAIVYQGCDDPADAHHAELAAMAAELAGLRRADGTPYRLFALPWAPPIQSNGRRLAASYANFLIVNGAVLMPGYGVDTDRAAAAVLAQAFPGHRIEIVPCRALIEQNGSLHCVTMQVPEGTLA